jgi:hypothetical protein
MKYTGWSRARRKRYIRALKRRMRTTLVAIDAYNTSTAIHEAAHAVLAVRLRLWLDFARLRKIKNSDFLLITGGHIKLKYPPVGNRAAERDIVMTCAGLEAEKLFAAGVEAQKLFAPKLTAEFFREIAHGARGDEKHIERIRKAHHIGDVEKLRLKAAFLVRVHRHEIFAVSCELIRRAGENVSARTIKNIYLDSQRRAQRFRQIEIQARGC